MTWNIKYGHDLYNNEALSRQVQLMASQNADVVILQEVSIYDGDQPSMYKTQLQAATGRIWYTSWAPSCSTGGCLGNLILSRLPLQSASMITMAPTASAQVSVSVGGIPVTIFAAHLDVDPNVRSRELGQLVGWVGQFGGRKILGADLNSWWGEWWPQQLVGAIGGDTWKDVTGNQDGGYTIGNVRFDYLFRSGGLTPVNCWVPATDLSDHRPVVADYRVQ
jgi:endonuclease/exonuclease/phosphatase family metal-dependent hydrolase